MTFPWRRMTLHFSHTGANLLSAPGRAVLPNFGFAPHQLLPTLTVILTMTAGTMFAIWLGQLITEQGIGNGLSPSA
ncbi:MAG: SecY family transport protein [Brockia lithotrophica]|nr:SecY family transport protein [Brockia lithotrophica]